MQNCLLFAFSTIIPQFFRPRSWSDLVYVLLTHDPYLKCLNTSIDFPSFYNRLASHKKHICAHALA
ncbi:unnamed protein product [Hymenolepis diminuta]|uniref:Uncharacterized protein n=1 Tax=Hymenolepis diminuta TaxID=6216 RepID=A0A564XW96_HYMDI|nr:unnamed protein product [Hymenolepis diminuta]